ncbi:hypothetical protein QYE76_028127 [Lolium multiflorum]|uniref:Dirigent protein n=1 Tax=Lolium multiflorum TaxID=4521 RepID=A0AAD8QNP3_LOLMU|nr:hypothetical protein QYE76_028127 [Lolium multiflorum]
MANVNIPSYHQSGPPSQGIVQKEHFLHLYVHQNYDEPNLNQRMVANPGFPNRVGELIVNDWVIRDGASLDAAVVGRAQGLHTAAGMKQVDWFFCDNILFTDKWYNGSSIQFIGKYLEPTGSKGEWAIIGGTGEFACAQGVASYEVIQRNGSHVVMDLHIRALCLTFPQPNPVIPVYKTELLGGNGGDAFDISEQPKRLDSVTIRSGNVIDSIALSYIDQAGNKKTDGPWGGSGGFSNTILLAPTEIVNKVFGTTGDFNNNTVVTSLTIVTNVNTYGPFGKEKGTPFSIPKENDKIVLGLFGRAGQFVDAIGAYVSPPAAN